MVEEYLCDASYPIAPDMAARRGWERITTTVLQQLQQ